MELTDLSGRLEAAPISDILNMAKEFQVNLWQTPREFHKHLGRQAIDFLGDPDTINGMQKIYVHAMGAFVLSEGYTPLSESEEFAVGKFSADEDWRVRANFRRFVYVEYQTFDSICLKLMQPDFINMDTSATSLEEVNIQAMTMYVPVHAVETVLAA